MSELVEERGMMSQTPRRIVHIHIPKTAGTSLRHAFERKFSPALRVSPHLTEEAANNVIGEDYAFFSGHIGYPTARKIGGEIITILRNPIDRMISTYYFWRELHEKGAENTVKTRFASRYSLEQFFAISDEPQLYEEFSNRAVWQLTHGSLLTQRRTARESGITEDVLLASAIQNLAGFAVVGIQENMKQFLADIRGSFDIELPLELINVTRDRAQLSEVPAAVIRAAQAWAYLDIQLYMHVCGPYQAGRR